MKQPLKSKYDYPPRQRRLAVHSLFFILIGFIALIMLFSKCTPSRGCRATRNMSGYSWLKCKETGLMLVTDMDGKLVCSYYDKPSK